MNDIGSFSLFLKDEIPPNLDFKKLESLEKTGNNVEK